MVTSAESVLITRTVHEVFEYVADLSNEPAWHEDVSAVPAQTEPIPVVGQTYPVTFKPFMGKTEGSYEVLAVEPDAKVVYRATLGGFQPQISYTFEPVSEGTRFTRSVDMRPRGLAALLTPMMALMVPRRNRVFVANLKRKLDR